MSHLGRSKGGRLRRGVISRCNFDHIGTNHRKPLQRIQYGE